MGLLFTISSGIAKPSKAGAIFDAIVAFETRVSVLDATIANDERLSDEAKEIWPRVSARLRKLYRKRHEVAHFLVPYEDMDAGERISPYFTWHKFNQKTAKYLSIPQLKERADKFGEAASAVSWFVGTLQHLMPLEGIQTPPIPQSDLVDRIRATIAQSSEAQEQPPRPSGA